MPIPITKDSAINKRQHLPLTLASVNCLGSTDFPVHGNVSVPQERVDLLCNSGLSRW